MAAVSVAGGDQQDQMTLQILLDVIDFGLSPAEAVTAPRFITDHFIGSFNQPPAKLASLLMYGGRSGQRDDRRGSPPGGIASR